MNKNFEEVWLNVVDNLRKTMIEDSFNLWIQPLKAVSYNDGKLRIQVPNKYFSDWIKIHQQDTIEKIIKEQTNEDIRLDFEEMQDLTSILKRVEDLQEPEAEVSSSSSVALPQDQSFSQKYVFDRFVVG